MYKEIELEIEENDSTYIDFILDDELDSISNHRY